jgi:magnesium and cobalt transporter
MSDQAHTRKISWFDDLIRIIKREPKNQQALIDILRNAEKRNLLDPYVLVMIEGALHVADMQVRDAMVAKAHMTVINMNSDVTEIINTVVESGHSRFPVIGTDINDVQGILLAKDLLSYLSSPDDQEFDIKDMMRPAVFIPESKRLNVLLREFRVTRNHIAMVVDEYGVTGLITIEDVIEEIVGEIEDEYDVDEEDNIFLHGRNRYTVKATTPIGEFNERFQTSLSDEEYDTIGGLIINTFGHLPKRGETLDFAGFNVKVLRADRRRIHLLRFERLPEVHTQEQQ